MKTNPQEAADDTYMGKQSQLPAGRAAAQRNLSRQVSRNPQMEVQPQWSAETWHGVTPCCGTSCGPACLQSCFAGKDWTGWLNLSKQRTLVMNRAVCVLGCIGRSTARGSREGVLPLCEADGEITSGDCVYFWAPSTDADILERVQWGASKMRGLEHMMHKERLRK